MVVLGAWRRTHTDDTDGFVAADAIVALTLAAMLLAVVLQTASISLRSSRAASERAAARVETQRVLLVEWPRLDGPGAQSGAAGRSAWSLAGTPVAEAAGDPVGLCAVEARARDAVSGRTLRLQTVRFCPGAGA